MKQKIQSLNKFLSRGTISKIIASLCVLLLFVYIVPHAHATGITVSNVDFNPTTGALSFDYTGDTLTGNQNIYIYDTTGTTLYWDTNKTGHCSSSNCRGALAVTSNSDSGVTSVIIEVGADQSQSLTYPLPLPTTNTPQTVRNDTQFYTLSTSTDNSTTTSTDVTLGTISLPVKSNVCVISEWIMENNNGNDQGASAGLVVDTSSYLTNNAVAITEGGTAFNTAFNYCIPNMAAGSHTIKAHIGQFPWHSGDTITLGSGSISMVVAYPTL